MEDFIGLKECLQKSECLRFAKDGQVDHFVKLSQDVVRTAALLEDYHYGNGDV